MEMYGETCTNLNEVRGWFKDPSLEAQAENIGKNVLIFSKAL